MKRFISILLTLCLLLSIIPFATFNSSASTISSESNYYSYKENYIKNYCTYNYLVNEMRLPYRSFVETLDNDSAFQVELEAWKLATISPDSLVEDVLNSQQYKYYEGILMDLLVRDTQEDSFVQNLQSFKDSIHVSAWKKYVNYNSKILQDTPITSDNADTILKEMKSMGNFSNALEYADTIGDYLDYAVDIYDLFDKLTKVEVIAQMSSKYSYVLQSMSNNCNNMYLRSAINNMVLIFSESITTQEIQYIFASKTAMNSVYTEFMKQVKKQVINSLGMVGLAVDLAQSTGTAVANSWFGTEDAISDYYQMRSLYEIEDLLRNVLLKSSGSTFCASFKMYENICLMGCDYSKKYVGPLYTSLFGKLFAWATNQNYENYCKQLDDLKSQISFMFDMIDVGADSWYVIDTENTDNMNIVNKNFNIVKYTKDDYSNANTDIQCDIFSTYGSNRGYSVKLTKDVVVNNSFDITGGTVDLNGHKLTVNGDLTVSNGILKMTNLYDKVIVNGNFTTKSSSSHTGELTDGTMEIKGNFNQIKNDTVDSYRNFNCSKNHRVIFNGTGKQVIHFDSTSSGFANVSFKNSSIEFNSDIRGWTLQEDTVIDNDTKLNLDNTLDLNGHKLTVKGSLQQGGGTININGGTLEVQGDYIITSGYLEMTNAKDKVIVGGNFTTKSISNHTGKLTDGTMEIKGNFNQIISDGYSDTNFNCSNNHRVIFNGTGKQTIHFDSTYSGFANVSLKNSNIEFDNNIRGWTLQEDTVIDNDTKLDLYNTLDLNGHKLTVKGSLQQGGGTININGGTLEVQGDYIITSGYLEMTNAKDKVIVGGNFTTKSISNHTGKLTDGTMEIKGNFNQIISDGYSDTNFNCSNNHRVIFNGTGKQTIHFDSTYSGFANVSLKNSNIEFDNNIRGWILQEDTVIDNDTELNLSSTLDLNGHKLTVKGSLQHGGDTININGGTLEVQGDYIITNGYLKMTNAKDKVIVNGNFTTKSTSDHSSYLTDGTMEIKGNFNQIGKEAYGSCYNFNCKYNHKVIFNGTGKQVIHFDSTSSGFANVSFKNSNIEFNNNIRGWTLQEDTVIDNDTELNLSSTLDLNGHKLTVKGNLQQSGSGSLNINGGTLEVQGDYTITSGYLKMTNAKDKVIVGSDFVTLTSSDHSSYLTNGIMEIKGNFNQITKAGSSGYNFNCSGKHIVILNGDGTQKVKFESSNSHFNILELTKDKDTGYSFESEKCWNRLFISGDANGDEKVTVADITVIQKYLANRLQLSDERLIACDVNKDGVVNIEDATLIQKYLIHLVPSLN